MGWVGVFALLAALATAHECTTDANCTDLNVCTNDTCDKTDTEWICRYEFNALPCNDSNNCTVNDRCDTGVCLGDHLVTNECSIPGSIVLPMWLFIALLVTLGLLMLLVMCYLCTIAITPASAGRGVAVSRTMTAGAYY